MIKPKKATAFFWDKPSVETYKAIHNKKFKLYILT